MQVPVPPPPPIAVDRATGDRFGLPIPAHAAALQEDGPAFLTEAFRAFGALDKDNAVEQILALDRCPGGSTGAKFFLTLTYRKPSAALQTKLFVKFSRDFEDTRRDHPGRYEMAEEVPFMIIARDPAFPIATAKPYFADYEMTTGTGLTITECVTFGQGGIEPHRGKCLDFMTLDDPLPYYRAIITGLARLSGAHKAGQLPAETNALFPFDPIAGSADLIHEDEESLELKLTRLRAFVQRCPQHFPDRVRDVAFLDGLAKGARALRHMEPAIRARLIHDPALIALCHWNAHIDNSFFWREDDALQCGFIDWGRVGQITLGSALWGALSASHHDIWDHHLDTLLGLFVEEYAAAGGPQLSFETLEQHLILHIATMGVARVLVFPDVVTFRCPTIETLSGPHDPAIMESENARNCLHILTTFLKLWEARDFTSRIAQMQQHTSKADA